MNDLFVSGRKYRRLCRYADAALFRVMSLASSMVATPEGMQCKWCGAYDWHRKSTLVAAIRSVAGRSGK